MYMGNARRAQEDYREAIWYFEVAASILPNEACPYWCLAGAYEGMGDYRQAEAFYRKAVAVDPENRDAKRRLDEWYERHYTPD